MRLSTRELSEQKASLRRFYEYLKTETESSLRNIVFLNKNRAAFQIEAGQWICRET
jgi:hypothetical protein